MFKIGSLLLIFILIACGKRNNEGLISDTITISIDSVKVNAKDKILFLNSNLLQSDLSDDNKSLFNFNLSQHVIEQIDLDEMGFLRLSLDAGFL